MREGTLFWTEGVATSKSECAVKIYEVSITINYMLRVIMQNSVDTLENVL